MVEEGERFKKMHKIKILEQTSIFVRVALLIDFS